MKFACGSTRLLYHMASGEQIEITRDGIVVATLTRAPRSPSTLMGTFAGLAKTNATDEELFSTGEKWNCE
jgi:antitoxin (DNA-binding transcriptional repressor) of toxin-antitoxin stability system